MARRQVNVLNEDSTLNRYVTYRQAYDMVNIDKEADWVGPRIVRLHPAIVRAPGANDVFSDLWRIKRSGGIAVWQMRSL